MTFCSILFKNGKGEWAMKKIRGKVNMDTCDLFSYQELKAKDTSPAHNVVCFHTVGSKLRAAKESNLTKDAINVILERAKKIDWKI